MSQKGHLLEFALVFNKSNVQLVAIAHCPLVISNVKSAGGENEIIKLELVLFGEKRRRKLESRLTCRKLVNTNSFLNTTKQ